jgi:hypothetical protein
MLLFNLEWVQISFVRGAIYSFGIGIIDQNLVEIVREKEGGYK